jgi:hypothetical protein
MEEDMDFLVGRTRTRFDEGITGITSRVSQSAQSTIENALRIAAGIYDKDAVDAPSLAEQFKRQAAEARALADIIEGCESMHLLVDTCR